MRCFGLWQCIYRAHMLGSTVVCGATLESSKTGFSIILLQQAGSMPCTASSMGFTLCQLPALSLQASLQVQRMFDAIVSCMDVLLCMRGPRRFGPADTNNPASTPRHTMTLCVSHVAQPHVPLCTTALAP